MWGWKGTSGGFTSDEFDTPAPAATAPAAPAAEPEAAAPETKRRGGRVAGADPSQTPDAIRKRASRRDKKNAAATTGAAGAFNQMTQQATQNASIERSGNRLAETLARKVQEQKQRMFETALMSGTQSVFKK
jgi:hypothetical protein